MLSHKLFIRGLCVCAHLRARESERERERTNKQKEFVIQLEPNNIRMQIIYFSTSFKFDSSFYSLIFLIVHMGTQTLSVQPNKFYPIIEEYLYQQ